MESDGYSTDESKRKRDTTEEERAFSKSRKIGRSPVKTPQKMEEKIETMMKMIEMMGKTMESLTTEIKGMREEQKEYRAEVRALKQENEKIRKENAQMMSRIADMDNRLERMENEKRRNNLVIQGLKVDTNDQEILKEAMENFIKEKLEIKAKIKTVIRLGEKTCLIQTDNAEEKKIIMENKSKLRKLKGERIYINDDLSKKDRDIHREIRKTAQEIKKTGKEVKMGYKKMYVEGEEWKWDSQKEELVKVDISKN